MIRDACCLGPMFGSQLLQLSDLQRGLDPGAMSDREAFQGRLPVRRVSAPEPGLNGHFVSDRSYSSGGRTLNRSSLRGW